MCPVLFIYFFNQFCAYGGAPVHCSYISLCKQELVINTLPILYDPPGIDQSWIASFIFTLEARKILSTLVHFSLLFLTEENTLGINTYELH